MRHADLDRGRDRRSPSPFAHTPPGHPHRTPIGAERRRQTASPQVIPLRAKPVKASAGPCSDREIAAGRVDEGSGQGSGVARPRSGRRALTPVPFGGSRSAVAVVMWSLDGEQGRGAWRASMPGVGMGAGWSCWVPLGHPFATRDPCGRIGSHDGVRVERGLGRSGSIRTLDRAGDRAAGVLTARPAPTEWSGT